MTILSENTEKFDPKEVKDRTDLRDVVGERWGTGKRRGRAVIYKSPWRSTERTASFAVYANGYQDFGAGGEQGDVYDWLQKEYGWTFPEALAYVARRLGNNPSLVVRPSPHEKTAAHEPPSSTWQAIMAVEAKRAAEYLWSDAPDARQALNYLRQRRGLSDETIRRWELGYNPSWRKSIYYFPEEEKGAWIPPGITIPWRIAGALWAIRVRCRMGDLADWLKIPPDQDRDGNVIDKYLHVKGSKQAGALFNGDGLTDGRDVLFTEGEFDAMLAQQILGDRLIAVTLGPASNQLSVRWLDRLKSAGQVFTLLDSDPAGQEATRHFLKALNCQPVMLPAGKDITDFVVVHQGDLIALIYQAWWLDGVPDTVRSALLTYFPPTVAPLIELVNRSLILGLLNPNLFTIKDLEQAILQQGHQIAPSTLGRLAPLLDGVFFSKLETLPDAEKLPSSFEKKSGKGRKPDLYMMLPVTTIKTQILAWAAPRIYEKHHPTDKNAVLARPLAAILQDMGIDAAAAPATAEELHQAQMDAYRAQGNKEELAQKRARLEYKRLQHDLEQVNSTPLPDGWLLNTAPLYRAAFLRAMVEADPDRPWRRRELQALLGIANGSIKAVVDLAGLKPDPQSDRLLITSVSQLPKEVKEYAYEVMGYPLLIESLRPDGQLKRTLYDQDTARQFIAGELDQQADVHIVFQLANKFLMVRSTPPPVQALSYRQASYKERINTVYTRRKKAKSAEPAFYGPRFNPTWIYGQLKLAIVLDKNGQYEWNGNNVVDCTTGEIHGSPTALKLLELVLGRPVESRDTTELND